MSKFWKKLVSIGLHHNRDQTEQRYITLTNSISVITSCISIAVLLALFIGLPQRGFTGTRVLLTATIFVFSTVFVFNNAGKYIISKYIISWTPPLLCLFISIYDKLYYPENITIEDFFSYRFVLLVMGIFPMLIYNTKDRKHIIAGLFPGFICSLFFDPLHNWFDLGFHQFGFNEADYYLINIYIAISYFGLIGFIYNLKTTTDRFEQKTYKQNEILNEKNHQIKEQHDEILTQSEELHANNEALLEIKDKIEQQNISLEKQVKEKTRNLLELNEQLILQNNELRQFSYTLSHHLKSPVATLKGLYNLLDKAQMNESNLTVLNHFFSTINSMDSVFHDLQEVLELRHHLHYQITEVDIRQELDYIFNLFANDILKLEMKLENNVYPTRIKTNEQKVRSILFNLISNAIKYHSNERKPVITLNSEENGQFLVLKIRDNGLGINLDLYGNKVFNVFQRFHSHVEGKGMGLFLVKAQVESLGGYVNLDSKVNEFTEFEVGFKKSN